MTKEPNAPGGVPRWPEDAELLGRVEALLAEGKAEKALALLARTGSRSAWADNAMGVCQLRLGNYQTALDIFRGLVVSGSVTRADAPAVFKANFAAALILTGNVHGGLAALCDAGDDARPAVQRLREAVRRWRSGLPFWQKVNWFMGGDPPGPVALGFPPGELG